MTEWAGRLVDVPDFPVPGIVFKDLTPLFGDAEAFSALVGDLTDAAREVRPDVVAGIEARGFIVGGALAAALDVGFVPIRKPNKLPRATHRRSYELEYGDDGLEIHRDAVRAGSRVLVVDDVLATGGTAAASCALVAEVGGEVAGVLVVLELAKLAGRERLGAHPVRSLLVVDD